MPDLREDGEPDRPREDREAVSRVLGDLVDYTVSHFSFEKAMMEQVRYRFAGPHRKVRELFTRRIAEFQSRFKLGEDVTIEMPSTLIKWLMNHIKREGMNYSVAIRASLGVEGLKPGAGD